MLLRIRTNVGVWRVEGLTEDTSTCHDIVAAIRATRPHVQFVQPLSLDPAGHEPLLNESTSKTLKEWGLRHGSMVYCRVDPETCLDVSVGASRGDDGNGNAASATSTTADSTHQQPQQQQQQQQQQQNRHLRKVIDKDGRIKLVPASDAPLAGDHDKGFRKGLLPLRDMKMQWTLNDFIALDSQYEFKIQRQESAVCQQVSLDAPSADEFQAYLQKFQFQRKRFGYLYGTFVSDDNNNSNNNSDDGGNRTATTTKKDDAQASAALKPSKVRVEAIYEPPQEFDPDTPEGFVPLDDPKEAVVDEIASMLGLRKVGWIFGGHDAAAREPGFVLSNAEIIMAAEFQLEAASGVHETPFVTVKVMRGSDGTVSMEAFQVSQQCMAMVAEEALQIDVNPKVCRVHETFTAIQEGKPSPTVENNFFLCVVPIVQHTSDTFISDFPRLNREVDDRCPSHDALRRQLQASGSSGWTFEDRLADFNLLAYLSDYLDVTADFPQICAAIANKQPLHDGYKLILKSLAGMEGSY